MHQSFKNGSLLFNMLGLFTGAGMLFFLLVQVSKFIAGNDEQFNYINILFSISIPILNFIIGWCFKNAKTWGLYLAIAEMLFLFSGGAYLLYVGDISGFSLIALSGPVLVWLLDIRKVFKPENL